MTIKWGLLRDLFKREIALIRLSRPSLNEIHFSFIMDLCGIKFYLCSMNEYVILFCLFNE